MIVDSKNKSLDDFGIPKEAPPAYDELVFPNADFVASDSSPIPTSRSRSSFQLSRRNGPTPAASRSAIASRPSSQKLHRPIPAYVPNAPRRDKPSLSAPLSTKTQADVRETIRGLVRDVVQGSSPVRSSVSAALGVLESCATACSANSISFARILQERSIENHAPIYWAIVSRPPGNEGPGKADNREDDTFLVELLAHAAPLTLPSVSELRAACLVASNNSLFQRLRSVPGAVLLSGTDRVLLQSTKLKALDNMNRDEIEKVSLRLKTEQLPVFNDIAAVREGEMDSNVFSVNFQLRLFQRRMRVSGLLEIEFIARGRLWQLIFFVVPSNSSNTPPPSCKGAQVPTRPSTKPVPPAILAAARHRGLTPGSWALALALPEGSTQCYAEARFVVQLTGKESDPDRSQHSPFSHSRSVTTPGSFVGIPNPNAPSRPPPLLPSHSSSNSHSEIKPPKRSFFRRTSEDKTKTKTHPSIVLNLRSSSTSPLVALPTPSRNNDLSSEELGDTSTEALQNIQRRTRAEKRAARAAAAREQREREGRETKRDLKERARLAQTVMIVGFEEVPAIEKSGKKDEVVRPEELMYDGCPYISPDGTLRATLEARLSTSPPESKDTDCVIC